MIWSIFSCVDWSFVYLLWCSVCSSHLPSLYCVVYLFIIDLWNLFSSLPLSYLSLFTTILQLCSFSICFGYRRSFVLSQKFKNQLFNFYQKQKILLEFWLDLSLQIGLGRTKILTMLGLLIPKNNTFLSLFILKFFTETFKSFYYANLSCIWFSTSIRSSYFWYYYNDFIFYLNFQYFTYIINMLL